MSAASNANRHPDIRRERGACVDAVPIAVPLLTALPLLAWRKRSMETTRLSTMRGLRVTSFGLLASITVGLGACDGGDATGPAGVVEPSIQTDRTEYFWEIQAADFRATGLRVVIPWTFTNPLPDTLFFNNCAGAPGPRLEKLVHGVWRHVTGGGSLDCLGTLIVIPGAEAFAHTTGGSCGFARPNPCPVGGDFDGTYRLNWSNPRPGPLGFGAHLFLHLNQNDPSTRGSTPLSPDVEIVSNPFTLIDPRDPVDDPT